VAGFDDGIRLSITRQQVRDLPPADADTSATLIHSPAARTADPAGYEGAPCSSAPS